MKRKIYEQRSRNEILTFKEDHKNSQNILEDFLEVIALYKINNSLGKYMLLKIKPGK